MRYNYAASVYARLVLKTLYSSLSLNATDFESAVTVSVVVMRGRNVHVVF